jgi:hypothetical protein
MEHASRSLEVHPPAVTSEKKFVLPFASLASLHVPSSQAHWWDLTGSAPKLARCRSDQTAIQFPIFIPSSGRASCALLDLSNGFPQKLLGKPFDKSSSEPYNQIVAVKNKDEPEYRKLWPGLTLLVLPPKMDDLGIGASRFIITEFASTICTEFPFCFVLDDSVCHWKGLILPKDPNPFPGWKRPCGSDPSKVKHVSTYLQEILEHFQQPEFVDLHKFAALGFGRVGRYCRVRYPYKRTHIYSAVILNLKLLKNEKLNYNPNIHVWEDLDFNERLEEKGLLLCKCQRFAQVKKQMPHGGANYMIARGTGERRKEPGTTSESLPISKQKSGGETGGTRILQQGAECRMNRPAAEISLLEHIKMSGAKNSEEVAATLENNDFESFSDLMGVKDDLRGFLIIIGIKGYSADKVASYCAKHADGGGQYKNSR